MKVIPEMCTKLDIYTFKTTVINSKYAEVICFTWNQNLCLWNMF